MNKHKRIITLSPFLLVSILLFIKVLNPSYVDEAGILHEKFFLIPLAYICIFVGIVLIIFNLLQKKKIEFSINELLNKINSFYFVQIVMECHPC